MQDLIKFIISSIIDKPEKLICEEVVSSTGVTNYIVHVDPEDMGKVIGKKGQIIQAVRTLIRVRALKEGKKAFLTLAED